MVDRAVQEARDIKAMYEEALRMDVDTRPRFQGPHDVIEDVQSLQALLDFGKDFSLRQGFASAGMEAKGTMPSTRSQSKGEKNRITLANWHRIGLSYGQRYNKQGWSNAATKIARTLGKTGTRVFGEKDEEAIGACGEYE
ncbi:MAG: hypothetical protein MMC23_009786 [Stictis urceolatum]|nr:hypothetical protein [Stictis urceolata]